MTLFLLSHFNPLNIFYLACTNLKSLTQSKQVHIISMGTDENSILVSKLINFYASFNLLVDAQIVTESSNNLDPLHWNTVISLYVRNVFFEEAIPVYKEMLSKNVQPADFTYPSVLKACGELLDCDIGVEVHKSVRDSSIKWSLVCCIMRWYLRMVGLGSLMLLVTWLIICLSEMMFLGTL